MSLNSMMRTSHIRRDCTKLPINFLDPVTYIDVRYHTGDETYTCLVIHVADEEGWNRDLIHQINNVKLREDIIDAHLFDYHLMHSNLFHEIQSMIIISATTHSSSKQIQLDTLALLWNVSLE